MLLMLWGCRDHSPGDSASGMGGGESAPDGRVEDTVRSSELDPVASTSWAAEWSVVRATVNGAPQTVSAQGHVVVEVLEEDMWRVDLVFDRVEGSMDDVARPATEAATIRVRLDERGDVRALDVDLESHLAGLLPLVQFVGDLALVQQTELVDETRVRYGTGGRGRVRALSEGWERTAYDTSLYLPGSPVRIVSSVIRRGAPQGPLFGLYLRETVADASGNAVTWTVTLAPEAPTPLERGVPSWHPLNPERPVASLVDVTRDVDRAGGLNDEMVLDALLEVLPHGEVGTASDWIPRYAAQLRLSPDLADRVVDQTLAHLGSANDLGLARVVDVLIASGTDEAEASLRRLFDAPAWATAPNALLTMQHLALFEGLSVETLRWAVRQAVSDADTERRVIATTIASSAMWDLRSTEREAVHEAASRLLNAFDEVEDLDMQIRLLRVMSNAGEPRFEPLARAALTSDDVELRAAGARLYRRVNTPEAWPHLLAAVDDPSDRVMDRALEALAEHPRFVAHRGATVQHIIARVARGPAVRWLVMYYRDHPPDAAACHSLLRMAPQAQVASVHERGWATLLEACRAMVAAAPFDPQDHARPPNQ